VESAGDVSPPQDRANARLLAGWIQASTGHLDHARHHITTAAEVAEATQDEDLEARCSYYLAYVVSHNGDFRAAMELTERSRAIYDTLDRPWDQAANGLFAARAAISAGDVPRSIAAAEQVQRQLNAVKDPWLHVRGEAIQGELARLQHRFADAVHHLRRAAETSSQLGFQQTAAYQYLSLGRAQCQDGDYDAGSATLELAIDKAQATGDVRLVALGRVHLGRVLRATGHNYRAREALVAANSWHHHAGGGEQAALGQCLLTAMDATDASDATNATDARGATDIQDGAAQRLRALLEQAQEADDAAVEVFALDALARLAVADGDIATAENLVRAADRQMQAASHFITDLDRVDARWAREVVAD
jgi:tetratricopeptide (TPR) repeat protein